MGKISRDELHPRRILILRPGAIGDTLLTFPSFRLLRERFPEANIEVVGNRSALHLAVDAGLIDRADLFGAAWVTDLFGDEPTSALRARLETFDLGIVWMHASDAADDLASRLARAGVRRTLALVSFPTAGSGRHVAEHLIDSLAPLGMEPSKAESGLAVRGLIAPRRSAAEPPTGRPPLIVLHPGAGARRKRWPADRFAALGQRFLDRGYTLAVTRGPADDDAVAAVLARLDPNRTRLLDGIPLADLAATFARAHLFVGNDSGMTHLAALVGVPTLAIFGPFDPTYWRPIGPAVAVVDAGQSCSHRADPREGCRQCDLLPTLNVEAVWTAATELVEREAHADFGSR